jgi:hypothetical protein
MLKHIVITYVCRIEVTKALFILTLQFNIHNLESLQTKVKFKIDGFIITNRISPNKRRVPSNRRFQINAWVIE